jgi:AraC-like DNA-binding protein
MPGRIQTLEYEAFLGRWRYSSASPAQDLAGVVLEYWEVEGRLSPFRERILPNGATEVMINLGPPHTLLTSEGSSVWDSSWFSGLHARAIRIESLSGTHLVSARLHPLGALRVLGPMVPQSVNAVVDLATLVGPSAEALRERLQGSQAPEERFAQLESFLRPRLLQYSAPSSSVHSAARLIEQAHGNLRIAVLHRTLGLSRKQLWLRFATEAGMSPKSYAGLQRFIWTLARLRESTEVDWSRLALTAGYSDQSHLVRDFRRVAAASPTEFLRTRSPDSTALLDAPG